MYYTYVICDKCNNELYIGYCSDLRVRVKEHLSKQVFSTKSFKKPVLIYYESCISKTDAIKRENQLKTGYGRGYLKRRLKTYFENVQNSEQKEI